MSTTWQKRESFSPLMGEAHVEVYLNPRHKFVGCGVHFHPDDCLCDVDLTKTEGMTWDQPPLLRVPVETAEDLILAGADIWLELDVGKIPQDRDNNGDPRPPRQVIADLAAEDVQELVGLVKERTCYAEIVRLDKYKSLSKQEYTFLLRALDQQRSDKFRKIPTARCIELHEQGLCPTDIARVLKEEILRSIHNATIAALLRRNGIEPHAGKRGRRHSKS